MSHILKRTRSKLDTQRRVSNSGFERRDALSRCRRFSRYVWFRPRKTARSSYSCWLLTIISSPKPAAAHSEAATREAMRSRGSVTIGAPAHKTSHPVVCALHSGVSRNTSARPERRMCRFLAATSVKMMRDWSTPRAAASARILGSPKCGKRRSQRTELGTRLRMLHHVLKVSGSYLYSWLEQLKMSLSVGRPTSCLLQPGAGTSLRTSRLDCL
mmetsp:Transcript_37167/g.94985  ORF Transcript_37167/g.94985 Transcript_37167/m.94985 type:complete len:214 (+) Transcript_37167:246-887(+)